MSNRHIRSKTSRPPPVRKVIDDKGLFNTVKENVEEFVYNGRYDKLIPDIIKYVHSAPPSHTYFKIKMFEKLWSWLRIADMYLIAFQRVLEKVKEYEQQQAEAEAAAAALAAATATATKTKPKSKNALKKEKKQLKKDAMLNKIQAKLGAEVLHVFGSESMKDSNKFFEDAVFLGFTESYNGNLNAPIGTKALEKAVNTIFENLVRSPGKCQEPAFTVVICICEGGRFKPIFHLVEKTEHERAKNWVGTMAQYWKKFSDLARQHKAKVRFDPKEELTNDIVKARKEKCETNANWAFSMITILHLFRDDVPKSVVRSRTDTPPSIERPRTGVSVMDFIGHPDFDSYSPILGEHEMAAEEFDQGRLDREVSTWASEEIYGRMDEVEEEVMWDSNCEMDEVADCEMDELSVSDCEMAELEVRKSDTESEEKETTQSEPKPDDDVKSSSTTSSSNNEEDEKKCMDAVNFLSRQAKGIVTEKEGTGIGKGKAPATKRRKRASGGLKRSISLRSGLTELGYSLSSDDEPAEGKRNEKETDVFSDSGKDTEEACKRQKKNRNNDDESDDYDGGLDGAGTGIGKGKALATAVAGKRRKRASGGLKRSISLRSGLTELGYSFSSDDEPAEGKGNEKETDVFNDSGTDTEEACKRLKKNKNNDDDSDDTDGGADGAGTGSGAHAGLSIQA